MPLRFGMIEGAIESIRIGAEEYLVKSFTDKELFTAVQRVLQETHRQARKPSAHPLHEDFGILGESEEMYVGDLCFLSAHLRGELVRRGIVRPCALRR